ncbi:6431_t:CDS:2, partial [Racocetra persica]
NIYSNCLIAKKLQYNIEELKYRFTTNILSLNIKQLAIYNAVIFAVDNNYSALFFVNSPSSSELQHFY